RLNYWRAVSSYIRLMGNRCRGCFSWGFKSLSGDSRKIQCHGGGRLRYALQHTIYRLDDQPNLLLGDEPNHHTKGIWSEEYGRSPKRAAVCRDNEDSGATYHCRARHCCLLLFRGTVLRQPGFYIS